MKTASGLSTTRDITYYFKTAKPSGLTSSVSQSTIDCVRKELTATCRKKRGEYVKLEGDKKVIDGEYAAQHGTAAAIRHFKGNELFPDLKEATVRGWKKKRLFASFIKPDNRQKMKGPTSGGHRASSEKAWETLLLEEKLEEEVKLFIKASRAEGIVVNTETVMGTATGVIISHDANLFAENGGYINITKEWAQRLLQRMGLVKCKGTKKKAKVL